MSDLTPKEAKFVDIVAKGSTSKLQAAIQAGYSPKTAHVTAYETLSKPRIQEALKERQFYYRSIAEVDAKDIIGAYQEMAFASIEDALDENGGLDFEKAKANGSAKLIKKITKQHTQNGVNTIVEFYPRTEALGQLTDILGIKQLPRENDKTIQTLVEEQIRDYVGKGMSEDYAREIVHEAAGLVESEAVN